MVLYSFPTGHNSICHIDAVHMIVQFIWKAGAIEKLTGDVGLISNFCLTNILACFVLIASLPKALFKSNPKTMERAAHSKITSL